jgi:tetratricopeptide (TPR) repeat protein
VKTIRPLPLLLVGALLHPLAPAAASAGKTAGAGVAESSPAVEAWEGTLDLPTDEEGPPDVNPPFDLFQTTRFNYPYTLRTDLTGRQSVHRYLTLNLENEYLKLVVLPELGGHIYSCTDKASGGQLFYANHSIRKARIGYRGAWAAFGVEFNFPVSHNWVSMTPVDHALVKNPDGSASIWVGNVDRVYGVHWRVELTLRPGSALLEERVYLDNPSPARHRFYWWNNAAVRVRDDSRIVYPMRFTASHWFREIDTWPVDRAGVDLSRVGNHLYGPVSLFAYGSHESFMGVYQPWSRTGTVHYSSPTDAPTKKIWSWGGDADGLDWRRALSDDDSAYVEVQAGLFRNQETYGFIEPQERLRFTEYWMPVRGIDGFTRANPEGVLYVHRTDHAGEETTDLSVGVDVNTPLAGGSVRVRAGDHVVASSPLDLLPSGSFEHVFPGLAAAPRYTVEVVEASGRVRIAHTEGVWDMGPASEVHVGPQPVRLPPPPDARSDGDWAFLGDVQEREGELLVASRTYAEGLRRFSGSFALAKAAGRLAVDLGRDDEAAALLGGVLARRTNDPEVEYYLGLARAALGDEKGARTLWERAQARRAFRAAALLELARSDAREGHLSSALGRVREVLGDAPDSADAGALEAILLRRQGRKEDARERLDHWLSVDPTSSLLRYEAVLQGGKDDALFRHLAGDPDRILGVAVEYMGLGLWDDAAALLSRRWPTEGILAEVGTPSPDAYPLIAYYRGFCRERTGASGREDFQAASAQPTTYVFPSRPESRLVLRAAIAANPADATARFLLGSLLLSGGDAEGALREWGEARRLNPRIPVLHRDIGMTLLHARADAKAALEAFEEGLEVDASNLDLYLGADEALSLLGRPGEDRLRIMDRYPHPADMPPVLLFEKALALAEAGRAAEAEALFRGRFFPREEGGTNVRQVFLEVRLRGAEALAGKGRCPDAKAVVRDLGRPGPGLDFTRDGLDAFIEGSRLQFRLGNLMARCGDDAAARAHWEKAEKGTEGMFLGPVYGWLAARRLGRADEAAGRQRLEEALARSETFLQGGTGFPGIVTCAQGLILRALGREDEARERFRRVFLLPDLRLSHFLARRALEAGDPLPEAS